jgi:hypothetical protein
MHSDRVVLVAAAWLGLALTAAPAWADEAETLFNEGRDLLKAGKTAEACDRFAASVAKFEVAGVAKKTVAATLNLADCREQNQQLATAWATFLRAATLAQNAGLRPAAVEARKRAGLLQPRISYLTIAIADASRVEGLTITRDGQPVEPALWNQSVPIDGGAYVVSAVAPGNAEWSAKVEVPAQNGKVSIEIPRLKRLNDFVGAVRPPPEAPAADEPEAPAAASRSMTPLQWGGIGVAGAGVIALGAGIYFGLDARSISDEASDWDTFDPERFDEGEAAERNSVIALGVGAACVVTGGVLYYLGHRAISQEGESVSMTPVILPDGVGLGAMGRF